jgi:hypothetical protein
MANLSTKLSFPDMLTKWSSQLNPLLASPVANPSIISSIACVNGDNVISHKLGQTLTGYIVILNSASATFFDKQNTNPSPDRTLILNSSAATTISLLVF